MICFYYLFNSELGYNLLCLRDSCAESAVYLVAVHSLAGELVRNNVVYGDHRR